MGTVIKRIRGTAYLYEQKTLWDPAAKRKVKKTRCLGRADDSPVDGELHAPELVYEAPGALSRGSYTGTADNPDFPAREPVVAMPTTFYAVHRDGHSLEPFLREWIGKAAGKLGVERITTVIMHTSDLLGLGLPIERAVDGNRVYHRARLDGVELVAVERVTASGTYQAVQPKVLHLGGRDNGQAEAV